MFNFFVGYMITCQQDGSGVTTLKRQQPNQSRWFETVWKCMKMRKLPRQFPVVFVATEPGIQSKNILNPKQTRSTNPNTECRGYQTIQWFPCSHGLEICPREDRGKFQWRKSLQWIETYLWIFNETTHRSLTLIKELLLFRPTSGFYPSTLNTIQQHNHVRQHDVIDQWWTYQIQYKSQTFICLLKKKYNLIWYMLYICFHR